MKYVFLIAILFATPYFYGMEQFKKPVGKSKSAPEIRQKIGNSLLKEAKNEALNSIVSESCLPDTFTENQHIQISSGYDEKRGVFYASCFDSRGSITTEVYKLKSGHFAVDCFASLRAKNNQMAEVEEDPESYLVEILKEIIENESRKEQNKK